MDLDYSDHLDFSKMQLAVRIDTAMASNTEQIQVYSVLERRMGRKVSDFLHAVYWFVKEGRRQAAQKQTTNAKCR